MDAYAVSFVLYCAPLLQVYTSFHNLTYNEPFVLDNYNNYQNFYLKYLSTIRNNGIENKVNMNNDTIKACWTWTEHWCDHSYYSQVSDLCFEQRVLSVKEVMLECNSLYVEYIQKFYGNEDENSTSLEDFCLDPRHEFYGSCGECIGYKKRISYFSCDVEYWPYDNQSNLFQLLKSDVSEHQKTSVIKQFVVDSRGAITSQEVVYCMSVSFKSTFVWSSF